jgi:hypothetical protein
VPVVVPPLGRSPVRGVRRRSGLAPDPQPARSSHDIDIVQEERVKGGTATRVPVQIHVYHDDRNTDEIDGDELRLRAQEMLQIADRYDEILAAQQ